MEIERAGPGDARLVADLLYGFNAEFGDVEPSADEFAARFLALLARDDVLVLLAGGRSEPLGFAFLTFRPTPYFDGPLAQLEELYVRPERRNAGIGASLIRAAVAELTRRGGTEMHIIVDGEDAGARRFYERHGFSMRVPGGDSSMFLYLREFD